MKTKARVIADFGKGYLVQDGADCIYQGKARAKQVDYSCGDWVEIVILNAEQAVIEGKLPRRNVLYRADRYKAKIIACNIDQVLFTVSIEPVWNENLLQRLILAAEYSGIRFIIVLNKIDLPDGDKLASALEFYQTLGYPVLAISAIKNVGQLKEILLDKTSLLVGQSGVGKSTIINGILGDKVAKVNEISSSLHTGRHTTTHTRGYWLDENSFIIDSPGLQKVGLNYIPVPKVIECFPDLKSYIGKCRFHNCNHQQEPDCAIKSAVKEGLVDKKRLELLQEIIQENSRHK